MLCVDRGSSLRVGVELSIQTVQGGQLVLFQHNLISGLDVINGNVERLNEGVLVLSLYKHNIFILQHV